MSLHKKGKVNEEKFIEQLGELDGCSKHDLLKELIDNSIDAGAKKINISFENLKITIQDDGEGMNEEKFDGITTMYYESQNGKIGKFGIGAKKAFKGLSNSSKVIISSKMESNPVYRATIDFVKILKEKQWTDNVDFETMSEQGNDSLVDATTLNKYGIKEHGTVIEIYSIPHILDELSIDPTARTEKDQNILFILAESYGSYIQQGVDITIDGKQVPSFDLLETGEESISKVYNIEVYVDTINKCLFSYTDEYKQYWIVKPMGAGYNRTTIPDTIPPDYTLKGSFNVTLKFPIRMAEYYEVDGNKSVKYMRGGQGLSKYMEIYLDTIGIGSHKYDIKKINTLNKEAQEQNKRNSTKLREIYYYLKDIFFRRGDKILSTIPCNIVSNNLDDAMVMNSIIKEVHYNPSLDFYFRTQENKSKLSWNKDNRGLDYMIRWVINHFKYQVLYKYYSDQNRLKEDEIAILAEIKNKNDSKNNELQDMDEINYQEQRRKRERELQEMNRRAVDMTQKSGRRRIRMFRPGARPTHTQQPQQPQQPQQYGLQVQQHTVVDNTELMDRLLNKICYNKLDKYRILYLINQKIENDKTVRDFCKLYLNQ